MLIMVDETVIEIWDKRGHVLPFGVRRNTWHPGSFFVVVKVMSRNKVWGYMYKQGVLTKDFKGSDTFQLLSCAGCYQWEYVALNGDFFPF